MKLSLDDSTLRIELSLWQKLLAVHFSTLEIPLAHIEAVDTEPAKTRWSELRSPGTFIPGLVKAGTYRRDGQKNFWCVTRGQPLIRFALRNEYFNSLTLGLKCNGHWVREVSERLAT